MHFLYIFPLSISLINVNKLKKMLHYAMSQLDKGELSSHFVSGNDYITLC